MDGDEPALVGAVDVEETVRCIGDGRATAAPEEAMWAMVDVSGRSGCV